MARARNIKPGFFSNEDLAELNPLTRLLFAGLWTLADREGRLENRPKRIKKEVLGYDNCNISDMISDLEKAGFIKCYSAGKLSLIQIVNWSRHQRPHVNEVKSELPSLDEALAPNNEVLADKSVPIVLNTDSLIPDADTKKEPTPSAVSILPVDEVQETVQRVWNYYVLIFKRASTYTFTSKRKAKAIARYQDCLKLARGDPEEAARLMKRAVDGLASSQFHKDGGYIDWDDNLFKSTEQLQKWLDKKQDKSNGNSTNKSQARQSSNLDAISEAVRRQSARETGEDSSGDGHGIELVADAGRGRLEAGEVDEVGGRSRGIETVSGVGRVAVEGEILTPYK